MNKSDKTFITVQATHVVDYADKICSNLYSKEYNKWQELVYSVKYILDQEAEKTYNKQFEKLFFKLTNKKPANISKFKFSYNTVAEYLIICVKKFMKSKMLSEGEKIKTIKETFRKINISTYSADYIYRLIEGYIHLVYYCDNIKVKLQEYLKLSRYAKNNDNMIYVSLDDNDLIDELYEIIDDNR